MVVESLRIACEPPVIRRALGFAVVVGAILIAINHGDALLAGDLDSTRLLKMGLTVVVPYFVSTLSSVASIRELRPPGRDDTQRAPGSSR